MFCACTKVFDDLAVLQYTPVFFSMLLTYNLFDIRQHAYSTIFYTSALSICWQGV